MNRKLILTVIILFIFFNSQNAKSQESIQKKETQYLTTLCKVWGFLKYYHPTVAHGTMNWDSVLISIIPNIKNVTNRLEFEKEISDLINVAGTFDHHPKSSVAKDSFITFVNWKWIESDFTDKSIKQRLSQLRSVDIDSNVYVSDKTKTGVKISFARYTENSYAEMVLPDASYRLLSLFRVWNIINYFFPYKNLMDKNWEDVLPQFIPRFLKANDTLQYHLLCSELMTFLNDGHAFSFGPVKQKAFGRYWVPFEIDYVEGNYLIGRSMNDSLFSLTNLKRGDIIFEINGMPVTAKKNMLAKYFGGSNKQAIDGKEIADRLLLSNDTTSFTAIKIIRDGEKSDYHIQNYPFSKILSQKSSQTIWRLINRDIGYVNMGLLQNRDTLKQLFTDVQNTKALILDFRYYPNFFVMYPFLSHVYKENKPFVKFLSQVLEAPGYFRFHSNGFLFEPVQQETYNGRIILLVNERSGSLGEFFPMALQALPNTTTIGSQTWGADGNQVGTVLPGNINIGFSGLGIFYPDGSICQRKGIRIDIIASPTIKGIKNGKDELLERAIEFIKTGK
jgi:carboxyl-terminal processing protease